MNEEHAGKGIVWLIWDFSFGLVTRLPSYTRTTGNLVQGKAQHCQPNTPLLMSRTILTPQSKFGRRGSGTGQAERDAEGNTGGVDPASVPKIGRNALQGPA